MRRLAAYPKRPRNEGQGLCSEVTLSVPAYADITTMQMMSLCEPVVNAVPLPDGNTRSVHTYESGLCWGAFLALESLSFDYVNQGNSRVHSWHLPADDGFECPNNRSDGAHF